MPYIKNKNGVTFLPPNTGQRNTVVGENFSASTTDRIFSSVLIPANTFKQGDFFDVYTLTTITAFTSNNIYAYLRIGTGGTTSDTIVGTVENTVGTYFPNYKRFFIRSVSGNTLGQQNSLNNDTNFYSRTNLVSFNINWAIDNYISVSVSAATSITTRYINVEYIKVTQGKCNLTV